MIFLRQLTEIAIDLAVLLLVVAGLAIAAPLVFSLIHDLWLRLLDAHIDRACRPGYDAGLLDGIGLALLSAAGYVAMYASLQWMVGL